MLRKNLRERLHVHAGVLVSSVLIEGVWGEVDTGSRDA
jgi:hypothetical protein